MLGIKEHGSEEIIRVPACVYCVAGIKNEDWEAGKMVLLEREHE